MSDLDNQYNSGQAPIVPEQNRIAGNLTETMLLYLKQASPWLRFLGILGFIGCGFTALGGIIFLFVSNYLSGQLTDFGNVPLWLLSIFYIAMGAVIFFPARFAYNFGSRISRYQFSNSDEDLELAFKNNKSLCKFYGITSIISLSLIPVTLIVSIIIGVIATVN